MLRKLKERWNTLRGLPTEDLQLDLWITQEQLARSATVVVELPPIGKTVKVDLMPELMREGRRLRFPGLGPPRYRDVYLNIRIGTPPIGEFASVEEPEPGEPPFSPRSS